MQSNLYYRVRSISETQPHIHILHQITANDGNVTYYIPVKERTHRTLMK